MRVAVSRRLFLERFDGTFSRKAGACPTMTMGLRSLRRLRRRLTGRCARLRLTASWGLEVELRHHVGAFAEHLREQPAGDGAVEEHVRPELAQKVAFLKKKHLSTGFLGFGSRTPEKCSIGGLRVRFQYIGCHSSFRFSMSYNS